MKKQILCLIKSAKQGVKSIRQNTRYVFVAGIFAVFGYYNLVIVPVAKIMENKSPSALVDVTKKVRVDIDANSSEKVYSNILQSQKGDWYRVGVMGQSLDTDEVLSVNIVTPLGQEKEIGVLNLLYDALHTDGQYAEFVFESDANYNDIVMRRVRGDDSNSEWSGGRISLASVDVSRLDIANNTDVLRLQPTLFGKTRLDGSVAPVKVMMNDVVTDNKTHFVFGQTFEGIGGNLSEISLNIAYDDHVKNDGKYRIELREYDASAKKIKEEVLAKDSFSLAGLEKRLDLDSLHHFEFPVKLDEEKTYFVGLSDNQVKKKGLVSVKKLPQDDGYIKLSLPSFTKVGDDAYLLTNAKFEDLGSAFRYIYQSNHKPSDLVDVFEMSGDVSFNKDVQRVLGVGGNDTFFTYRIDTVKPFTDLRVQATEVGIVPAQVRLEYSYDNENWQDISFTQPKDMPQAFDMKINNNTQKVSTIFVKVSAMNQDAGREVFGLDVFRVIADIAKDNR